MNIKNFKKTDLYYTIAYTLFIFTEMFTNVFFISNYSRYIKGVMVLFLLVHIITQTREYKASDILRIVVITCILIISCFFSKTHSNLVLFFLIFSIKEVDTKKLVKFDIKIKIIFLIIIVCLYYMGFTENYYLYRNGIRRSSMGFSHPNKFGTILFSIYCEYIYLKNKHINIKAFFGITLAISFAIYYFCDSRTSIITTILLFLLIVVHKYYNIFNINLIKKIFVNIFTILLIISYILGVTYNRNNKVYMLVDNLLSTRIKSANIFLNNYNVNLFGNELDFSEEAAKKNHVGKLILDNAYIRILLNYGLIYTIAFGYMYILLMKKSLKDENMILFIILSIFAIRGLVENNAFALYANIFLLYIYEIIYIRKGENINLIEGDKKYNREMNKVNKYLRIIKSITRERIIYFKLFRKYKNKKNIKIDKQTKIYLNNNLELSIDDEARVQIGKDLAIRKNVSIRCRKGANLILGNRIYFNNNCVLTCRNKIIIGDDTSFGPNVIIFDHDHDYKSKNRGSEFISKEITIGKNVWVGANACILKGSNIGDNCVIAAGAVVNNEVPKNCIYYSKNNIKNIEIEE